MLYHLESAFFGAATLERLVYAAPFVAPLSYTGIGMLLLLNRMEKQTVTWARWVLFLAAAGFVGNFGLSLLDHAQNGFFIATEWIPVVSSAVAVGFLVTAVVRQTDPTFRTWCVAVLGAQVVLGVVGAVLHLSADVAASTLRDKLVFGPPAFAPLLFADLAILGVLGLWALHRDARGQMAVATTGA